MAGVLALREFTAEDLSKFSGVAVTTVRSWLARNQKLFERHAEQPRGKGRPPHRHRVKPRACAKLERLFERTPASTFESELEDSFELFDLDHALRGLERYADLLDSDGSEEEFAAVVERLEEMLERTRLQVTELENAGIHLATADLQRLREVEGRLVAQRSQPADLDEDILVEVNAFLANLEKGFALPHVARSPTDADPGLDVGALGVLAAVGLSEKLHLPSHTYVSIKKVANSIQTERYVRSLDAYFLHEEPSGRHPAFVPILHGIRNHARLRNNGVVAELLDGAAEKLSGVAASAYAMTRLCMPHSKMGTVVKAVRSFEVVESEAHMERLAARGISTEIVTAVKQIGEEAREYGARLATAGEFGGGDYYEAFSSNFLRRNNDHVA
ncbi:hypothetical protein LCM4579_27330 [Ensifer sp. LCM 4579]|nr:hypothetical protein LCM4579_27330 [Ensifer sp. LCM 4579]